jgi:hypothetical protein
MSFPRVVIPYLETNSSGRAFSHPKESSDSRTVPGVLDERFCYRNDANGFGCFCQGIYCLSATAGRTVLGLRTSLRLLLLPLLPELLQRRSPILLPTAGATSTIAVSVVDSAVTPTVVRKRKVPRNPTKIGRQMDCTNTQSSFALLNMVRLLSIAKHFLAGWWAYDLTWKTPAP